MEWMAKSPKSKSLEYFEIQANGTISLKGTTLTSNLCLSLVIVLLLFSLFLLKLINMETQWKMQKWLNHTNF